jgi:hypothetical protein
MIVYCKIHMHRTGPVPRYTAYQAVSLLEIDSGAQSNVLRGIEYEVIGVRPNIHLVRGRLLPARCVAPYNHECIKCWLARPSLQNQGRCAGVLSLLLAIGPPA